MLSFYIVIALLAALNVLFEYKRDLMMLQQNSYRNNRYRKWLSTSGDSTSMWRLGGLIIFFMSLTGLGLELIALPLIGLYSGAHAGVLVSKKYKLPLVWTKRAMRIYSVFVLLAAIICIVVVLIFGRGSLIDVFKVISIALLGCYCGSHILIMLANILLIPVEKSINRGYYNDAAARLASMPDLKIIGITGSFGKTSTKHYLHRILSEQFDTLMTPGNFNTDLGVIRTIREYLKPYNEVFIVEMGAKEVGDIKVICDLVHPTVGVVTAVGPMHLETFKSIENIQSTKFELIDSLPADGLAVINNDFELIENRKVDNVSCVRYAVKHQQNAQLIAEDISYSHAGTDFIAKSADGWSLKLHTRLVGECNISNLLAAVAVARHLGVSDEKIRYAVGEIGQVEHRLSIKRALGGVVVIDDAYNSNPVGSAMALDVLAGMKGGRRVAVTPGMVELGERTYELNKAFGEKIAASADIAVVVCRYNRDAIMEGIKAKGMSPDSVYTVDTFADAQKLLASILKAGDTVLYENDLPDTFK